MREVRLKLPDFHPKQQLFFDSKATEILWAGDTRGGKSAGVKLALCEWCVSIPGLQCDVWRLREDDVINGFYEGEFGLPTLLAPLIHAGFVEHNKTEFRFKNGSLISLENCWTDAILTKVQGIGKHVRVIDEAGQIPESRLKKLKLWMTMSEEMKAKIPEEYRGQFPKLIYLMNRMGTSKGYFKRVFVRSRPKYQIEKVGQFYQQYIPAFVRDNPSESAEDTIARVTDAADSQMAKALLSEDGWDAQTGNYFEMWDSEKHVIKSFIIPDFWLRYRCFDYGSYEPWACTWWAVSPGVLIHEGTEHERYLPRGCKVCYREWYGCKAEYPKDEKDKLCTNLAPKGWSNTDMANGIIERTEKQHDNQPTFTDKFPFIKLGGRDIATDFKDAGLPLTLGETDRQNRGSQTASLLNGERINASSEARYPMMVFFEECKYCQDYMPMIERHEKEDRLWDYKEDGEPTHIVDTITMSAMAHKVVFDAEKTLDEAEMNRIALHPRNKRSTLRDIAPGIDFNG